MTMSLHRLAIPPPSRRRGLAIAAAVLVFAMLAALAIPSLAHAAPAQAAATRHEAGTAHARPQAVQARRPAPVRAGSVARAHAKALHARPAPPRAGGAARAHAKAVHARSSISRAGGAPRAHAKASRPDTRQVGIASYYASRFAGRRMADGTPMRPESDNAASRTLPLGSMARVTNLQNGRSAVVTIRDRGPHIRGRIIDLSPRTALQLGFLRAGVARVEVTPLTAARPDAGAASASVAALSATDAKDSADDPS